MTRQVRVNGTLVDACLDDSGYPGDDVMSAFEAILEEMKDSPGDANIVLQVTIVNDFEPEEDDEEESEDESSDDATPSKEA